ncbi:hypothetical protein PILCRDRAFT_9124 [Piloderma croceum F 1598]|uniref:Uncharacterized protein n=1 Tax=Piloderma croceum (strain F 1598) TaxID=765440 RepID=A0A0C3B4I3_PILCF|nr:hypothetical protein PILCRDRAFT_9124 [Piloderma croceum F 1598]
MVHLEERPPDNPANNANSNCESLEYLSDDDRGFSEAIAPSFVVCAEGYDGETRQSFAFVTPPTTPRREQSTPMTVAFNVPAEVTQWSQLSFTLTPHHPCVRGPVSAQRTHSAPPTPSGARSSRPSSGRQPPVLHVPSQPLAQPNRSRLSGRSTASSSQNTRAEAACYVIPPRPTILDPIHPPVPGFCHPLANEYGHTPHMGKGKHGYYSVTKGLQIGVFYDLWENVAKISKDIGGNWFKGDNHVQAICRYDEEDDKRIIEWD